MVPMSEMLDHFFALGLVWCWAWLAGRLLAGMAGRPRGFAPSVLLGIAFWATALFLLPFRHGLDIAALVVIAGNIVLAYRNRTAGWPAWTQQCTRANGILLVGCGAYATLLLTHFVPPGMDASMHTTAARLIAEQNMLPRTFAPMASDISFTAVNVGLPAVASLAIRCGAAPVSAMLAAEQLTFAATILATYLMLRLWTRQTPAALLAVFALWSTRGAQETVGWGGFPTVAAMALGLYAARLLIDVARRPHTAAALPLGILIAALPLVHGVAAATWLYGAAPLAVIVGLKMSRQRRAALVTLGLSAGVAIVPLIAYVVVSGTHVSEENVEWTRNFQKDYAPAGEGWALLRSVPYYVRRGAGNAGVLGGVLASFVLLWHRRWAALAVLLAGTILLCLLVANSRVWLLPMSMLLYPERVIYWATPLAAVAMALAWQALTPQVRRSRIVQVAVVGILVIFGIASHIHGYQRMALCPVVTELEWEALCWAEENLDRTRDFVDAPYKTAGSYLPAVSGVGVSGWHIHHFSLDEVRKYIYPRQATYQFVIRGHETPHPKPTPDNVVFANRDVVILRLGAPGATSN
jgi:hypothetical protein